MAKPRIIQITGIRNVLYALDNLGAVWQYREFIDANKNHWSPMPELPDLEGFLDPSTETNDLSPEYLRGLHADNEMP